MKKRKYLMVKGDHISFPSLMKSVVKKNFWSNSVVIRFKFDLYRAGLCSLSNSTNIKVKHINAPL